MCACWYIKKTDRVYIILIVDVQMSNLAYQRVRTHTK